MKMSEKIKGRKKGSGKLLVFLVVLLLALAIIPTTNSKKNLVTYTDFIEKVNNEEVTKVVFLEKTNKVEVFAKDNSIYYVAAPKNIDGLEQYLMLRGVTVEHNLGLLGEILMLFNISLNLAKLIFLLGCISIMFVIKSMKDNAFSLDSIDIMSHSGLEGQIMQKQDGPSDLLKPVTSDIKFEDVRGIDEIKNDIVAIVDFLKNPKKYEDMGARIHKGIILYGPPGTGKTLTAKAIAGEAEVPFFSINGSEFMDTYVGVGAKRVRELYATARKHAPCIVFIDEIDSIGGKREGFGNSDEKDRTVNQLLSELDGFDESNQIITIVATNRVDMLDEALVRPGRFDKHLAVPLPDKDARYEILKHHADNKKLSKEVCLKELAKTTVGFSGAALESLLNEAAFLAAVNNKTSIGEAEISRAMFKQTMKGDIKDGQDKRASSELELVAWHEAGHALLTKLLTEDEVTKVTILASTSGAGGVTFTTPADVGLYSKEYIESEIAVLYGGRIAELLLLGSQEKITTGASNDIQQATNLIKGYITHYGMSDSFGLINVQHLLGHNSTNADDIILREAQKLSNKVYKSALNILTEKKEILEDIANQLLDKETLTNKELDEIIAKYEVKNKAALIKA